MERLGAEQVLAGVDGLLVPGGFGYRGIHGKMAAISMRGKRRCRSSASAWACNAR